jgi:putative methionine-R-sulfoxide reductase with GAF domain
MVVLVRAGDGEIRGVLDVDADKTDAFTQADVAGLEQVARMIHAA